MRKRRCREKIFLLHKERNTHHKGEEPRSLGVVWYCPRRERGKVRKRAVFILFKKGDSDPKKSGSC